MLLYASLARVRCPMTPRSLERQRFVSEADSAGLHDDERHAEWRASTGPVAMAPRTAVVQHTRDTRAKSDP